MTQATHALEALQQFDWRARLLSNYFRKWIIIGTLIGVIAGLGAILFFWAIEVAQDLMLSGMTGLEQPMPAGEGDLVFTDAVRPWLLPVVTTLGGVLSGLIVFTLAPEAEGHGTDAAIDAFHERGGLIRSRIPPIKLVASALTIGSGGSAGREGPTAQIAAGFGSWLGDAFKLTPEDRRIAVAVGMGAGIGAIFKAPLGGAILAAEILYVRDFELEALVPAFIASVIGFSIFGAWAGWTPVFGETQGLHFNQPESLLWYAALGAAAGLGGIAYARTFYGTRDLFHRVKIPPHFKPAIGGLAVGLIALAYPEVLSMGYGWIQFAINGDTTQLAVRTMLILVALKIVATSLTIGSGGSGGVFAPGLFIGAMLGGGMWGMLHNQVPWMPQEPAPFVIVGMMALFGGIAKAPIAVILMVAEMTSEFSMIVPAMMATSIAYLITGPSKIYESQVETRANSPAHRGEFTIPLVQAITVVQAMRREVVTASPSELVPDVERRMQEIALRGMPVVEDGKLVGMFTITDALKASRESKMTVGEAMTRELVVAYPSDSLHTALQRMTRATISRLPVVEREAPERLIGILSMKDVAAVLDLEVSALSKRPRVDMAPPDDPLRSVIVADAMSRRIETVEANMSLKRAANRLAASGRRAALIVDEHGFLKGIVTLTDLEQVVDENPERPIGELIRRRTIVAYASQTVAEALAQPDAGNVRQLPVVEQRDGGVVPVGMLSRSDVVAAYLRGRDRQSQIARRAQTLVGDHKGNVVMLELSIRDGSGIAGQTLAELRLPRDAVVTAVIRGGTLVIPRGQVRLQEGDRVQILSAQAVRDEIVHRFSSEVAAAVVGEDGAGGIPSGTEIKP